MASIGSRFYKEFLGQTGTISLTNLFTPSDDGLYLATVYIEDLTSEDGSLLVTFGWTDKASSKTKVFQAGSIFYNPLSIHQAGSSPFTIQATDGGAGHTYNIFVSIESLSVKI